MITDIPESGAKSISTGPSVLVVGGGIVGLSIALRLQLDGFEVTVLDRDKPMEGCSAGNAGYISQANIFPPVTRDILVDLPRMLVSRDGPLVVRPGYLKEFVPWACKAMRAGGDASSRRIQKAMSPLLDMAWDSFIPLLEAAGAGSLLERCGGLVTFQTTRAFQAKADLVRVWNRMGLDAQQLDRADVLDLEPALSSKTVGGIFFPQAGRCLNPKRLGLLYLDRLVEGGAQVMRQELVGIETGASDRVTAVLQDGRRVAANYLVLCTGANRNLAEQVLRQPVPLGMERGYHLMLPTPRVSVNRPVVFGEDHFVATPMEEGLRLAGTAEFAHAGAAPDMRRAHMLQDLARKYLPVLGANEDGRPWMGVRPTLPDGMPAMGCWQGHPRLLYALGHGHNGLTTSAVTARCIAALVSDRPEPLAIDAFSIKRFR